MLFVSAAALVVAREGEAQPEARDMAGAAELAEAARYELMTRAI
jgi:hypothetical protein